MKKRNLLAITFLALTLQGCGRFLDKFGRLEGGLTQVVFQQGRSALRGLAPGAFGFHDPLEFTTQVLDGGVIVYARNTVTGAVFSTSAASEAGPLSLNLPNGQQYSIMAAGWAASELTGPASPSDYRLRCGDAGVIQVDPMAAGASMTVNIELVNPDLCYGGGSSNAFGPSGSKTNSPMDMLLPLKIVPCGGSVDLSAKTISDECGTHEASSHFFKGDGAGDTKMGRGVFFETAGKFYFTATHDAVLPLPHELFEVTMSTGAQRKMPVQITGTTPKGVIQPFAVTSKNRLLFIKDQGTSKPRELWSYNLTTGVFALAGPPTCTSPGVPSGCVADDGTMRGVEEFRVSPNGSHIVFVGETQTDGKWELFTVPIPSNTSDTFNTPQKISDTMAGAGIRECVSCGDDERYAFAISPVSPYYVLYSATQAQADRHELYFANLSGGTIVGANVLGTSLGTIGTGVKISGTEIAAAGDFIDTIKFSYDGAHAIYHVMVSAGPVNKVHSVDISFVPGTSLTVSGPSANTTHPLIASNAGHPYVITGNATKRVLLPTASGTTATMKAADLASPATVRTLFDVTLASNAAFYHLAFTPDDSYVVAATGNQGSPYDALDLRSAPISLGSDYGSGGAPNGDSVTHATLAGGQVIASIDGYTSTGPGGKKFLLAARNTSPYTRDRVLFISDAGNTGIFRLYKAIPGTAGATDISGNLIDTTDESVKSLAASGTGGYFFNASIERATGPRVPALGQYEMYQVNTANYDAPTLRAASGIHSILEVGGGHEDDLATSKFPVMGNTSADTATYNAYVFDSGSNTYSQVTKISGASAGLGRVRVRMLKRPDGATYETAFSSACLDLSTAGTHDGSAMSSSVRIPLGLSSLPGPFATAVDVFPLDATACTGSSTTYLFPEGLDRWSTAQGANARLIGDGAQLKLFLRD